jgi:hypothetical protein
MRLTGVHLKQVTARNYNTGDSLMKLDNGNRMSESRHGIQAEYRMIYIEWVLVPQYS